MLTTTAANSAGTIFGDRKNPIPVLDDALNTDGPSGETLLNAITEMSVDEIVKEINFALEKTYTRAKPPLDNFENPTKSRRLLSTSPTLAITATAMRWSGFRDSQIRTRNLTSGATSSRQRSSSARTPTRPLASFHPEA